ncbi:uncharacterized protein MONOS_13068 [Monocercomonoides exilis]|uniref:uncharacterized protein n=1 Tax=Monocercomonoides exilis TaxID=2049356 RepID=UPI00355A779E|nr:hypothetical protein MONOS_13068 [Monocercomonoides exilis]|eukprot:MONOS_13068.1-p1 / transcript=MONOS_13068.1 / gene=MONOS_13068 / organism=Monocercomonoides_exilis_PA203 / gene_product=unspecified product / transcript_product=unspecified product / location=Mono_scaffold00774:11097-11545(-) / protein_length=94 / sequence_SO=supercontig / SO=protein_coding / is_pseudo=false
MQYQDQFTMEILSTFEHINHLMVLPLDVYFSVNTLVTFSGKSSFWIVLMVVVDSPISAWTSKQRRKQYVRYRNESDKICMTAIEELDNIKMFF